MVTPCINNAEPFYYQLMHIMLKKITLCFLTLCISVGNKRVQFLLNVKGFNLAMTYKINKCCHKPTKTKSITALIYSSFRFVLFEYFSIISTFYPLTCSPQYLQFGLHLLFLTFILKISMAIMYYCFVTFIFIPKTLL